jgi:hypothetical protein
MGLAICTFALLVGALLSSALLAGCQVSPDVPDDAKLLYYGPVDQGTSIAQIIPMEKGDSPRQVYVYDDTTGKVVAVRTVDFDHRDLAFQWKPNHEYRIYFY